MGPNGSAIEVKMTWRACQLQHRNLTRTRSPKFDAKVEHKNWRTYTWTSKHNNMTRGLLATTEHLYDWVDCWPLRFSFLENGSAGNWSVCCNTNKLTRTCAPKTDTKTWARKLVAQKHEHRNIKMWWASCMRGVQTFGIELKLTCQISRLETWCADNGHASCNTEIWRA